MAIEEFKFKIKVVVDLEGDDSPNNSPYEEWLSDTKEYMIESLTDEVTDWFKGTGDNLITLDVELVEN